MVRFRYQNVGEQIIVYKIELFLVILIEKD